MTNPLGQQGIPINLKLLQRRILNSSVKLLLIAVLHQYVIKPVLQVLHLQRPLIMLLFYAHEVVLQCRFLTKTVVLALTRLIVSALPEIPSVGVAGLCSLLRFVVGACPEVILVIGGWVCGCLGVGGAAPTHLRISLWLYMVQGEGRFRQFLAWFDTLQPLVLEQCDIEVVTGELEGELSEGRATSKLSEV